MNINIQVEDIPDLSLKECNDILNEIRDIAFWELTCNQNNVVRDIEDRKAYLEKNGFLSE